MAGAFGFGARSPFGSPSDEALALALAQAAGGVPAGFSGAPGLGLPPSPGLPTIRPRPFGFGGLPMPQMPPGGPDPVPTPTGIPVKGGSSHDIQQQLAARKAEQQAPRPLSFGGLPAGTTTVPLPPQRPPEFDGGDPRGDLPVEGAQPVMGQMPQSAPAVADGPSFGDRILSGLHDNADYFGALGAGFLSAPTWAGGLSAGMQLAQRSDAQKAATGLARAEMGLKVQKLQKEQQGENATVEWLTRKGGYSREDAQSIMAAAAAGNREALNNAMGNIVPKRAEPGSGYTIGADGRASYIPGGPQDPAVIAAQAAARSIERDEPQLVDVPGPNGTTQKQWVRKGQASGLPVGEAKAPAPMVKEFTGPDGVKRPHTLDAGTGQWKPIDLGDGSLPSATGNPFATGKFNNDQGKAAGFSDRMFGSERILRDMETINQGAISGTIGGLLPNVMKSSDRQQLEQSQRDFVNAQLRRESGAAIAKTEFQNAERQYFPQPGDSDAVVQQKRANRQRAISAMGREGGPSYRPQFTFDQDGALVPFQVPQRGMATTPSRSDLEAEARRRGLMR